MATVGVKGLTERQAIAVNCTKSLDTQIEAVDTEIGLILEQDNII